ncbi:TonB-dependent receptor [Desulfococcaceae bacterium HSG8]|nr:TonB-dependent receptor [Desulfococcaceae bacterium HSG8]
MLILVALAAVPLPQVSAEKGPADIISEEERRLLEILEKHTELATRTRMNADFVPGMVTVYYGDDLEARGIGTIGEAMALVPGISFSLSSDKFGKTLVRGIPRIFASGHIKVLLNGVPLTTTFGIDPVPNIPTEQVERIEIMRGPGSAIHGEFAYAGVMNIITRRKDTRIFGGAESDNTYKSGGIFSLDIPDRDIFMSLNIAGLRSESENVSSPGGVSSMMLAGSNPEESCIVGADETFDAPHEIFHGEEDDDGARPNIPEFAEKDFDVNETYDTDKKRKDYRSGIFTLDYKDFSLHTHLFENKQEDFYKMNQWSISVHQKMRFSPSLRANLKLGWQKQEFEAENTDSYSYQLANIYPNGWMYGLNYDESLLHGGIELIWKLGERHRILAEWAFARSELKDVCQNGEESVLHVAPDYDFSPVSSVRQFEGMDRLINSVTIQDEFRISERFTLTGGMRYDHYDDIGEKVSPRFAAVYRLNKQPSASRRHILKAQYARAFRPPTFLELYASDPTLGISDIESEIIDTCELGYIFRSLDTVARITLFYSDSRTRIGDMRENPEKFYSSGTELELERQLIRDTLKLDGNLSYVKTKERETGQEIPQAAEWLANIGMIYRPSHSLLFALQYSYAGGREDIYYDDGRDDSDKYHTVNLTANIFDMGFEGLILSAGVKNLFEEDIRYSVRQDDFGRNEISEPERWWWIKISHTF